MVCTSWCLHTHVNGAGSPLVKGEMLQSLAWLALDVRTGGLQERPTGEVGFVVSFQPLASLY